ncbi:MAG: hypothetical protein WC720_05215 [Candidatus Shapirobacteria bacterium]|jgi:hypothetical protein
MDMKKNLSYSEKLKHPLWQKKRLEIMERDKFTCQSCYDNESTLNVHHSLYLKNHEIWDYPSELLVTLCENCHQQKHELTQSILITLAKTYDNNSLNDIFEIVDILAIMRPDKTASILNIIKEIKAF